MWPFRKQENSQVQWKERVHIKDAEVDEYEEDEGEVDDKEKLFFLIHFTKSKVYVYVAGDEFYEDEGVMKTCGKDYCVYRFMGECVSLEKKVLVSRTDTINEVLEMYDLKDSENAPYKIIEIEPYQDEDDE